MIVVSDTSPLSNLVQVGRQGLLRDLYGEVIIPPSVEDELRKKPELHRSFDWKLIRVVHPKEPNPFLETADLDLGEIEAIALALELEADLLLIDEFAGRLAAGKAGLRITGLLGVLLESKARGLVASVREEIDRLTARTTFRISMAVREEVLRLAGES